MGRSDLHYAALEGRAEDVRDALARGEDPSLADRDGFTPLHFAAQEDQAEAAGLLLQAGAALEARNKFGNTPLWVALMHVHDGDGGVVRLLLAEGASLNAANDSGVTPRDLIDRVANYDLGRFLTHE